MKSPLPQPVVDLLASLPEPLEEIGTSICNRLVADFGASLYVKTIYVGVEIDGAMVAALYPASDHLDVALALAEDHPSSSLEDATHLTWPSLPVMVCVRSRSDPSDLLPLVDEAGTRVANAEHDVERSPEFFRGRTQRLSHDPRIRRPKEDE